MPSTPCILYPQSTPQMDSVETRYAVMGKNGDPKEFFGFLMHLSTDMEFYQALMLGEEDVDYTIHDDGTYTSLPTDIQYNYPHALAFLRNEAFDRRILPQGLPANYNEEMEAIAYPQENRCARIYALCERMRTGPDWYAYGVIQQNRSNMLSDLLNTVARKTDPYADLHGPDVWWDSTELLQELNGKTLPA